MNAGSDTEYLECVVLERAGLRSDIADEHERRDTPQRSVIGKQQSCDPCNSGLSWPCYILLPDATLEELPGQLGLVRCVPERMQDAAVDVLAVHIAPVRILVARDGRGEVALLLALAP